MPFRAPSLRHLGLFFLLAAVTVAGFVAAGLAQGASRHAGAPETVATESVLVPEPAGRVAPATWLGYSGRLRAVIDTPESLSQRMLSASLADSLELADARQPGLHDVGLTAPDGDPFYVVSLLPYAEKEGSRLGGYYLGNWPNREGVERYRPPSGFIEVTPANEGTAISKQFHLKDFLTHDQTNVWPKYLVVKPRLLDKLELISAALADRGLPSRLHVMSGFRTPQYNEQGVGEKGGRASLSRHMYGDAADVFVDQDGNGVMDDLNGDGRVTVADARVLFSVAESVEASNPDLVGGLSPYSATSAHGPFVHVDTRGVKARW